MPRRGSWFSFSTSSAIVRLPSPTTCAGTRSAIATMRPADHQHPIVVAGHEGLHDDLAAPGFLLRAPEPGAHGAFGPQVEPHAAAVVAVQWLRHHREPDPLRGRYRIVLVTHDLAAGNRQSGRGQELFVIFLSPAMSTARALVFEVIVARIRC